MFDDEFDRQQELELQHDEELAALRRRLTDAPPVLGVIFKDGNGESFEGVNWDSVAFDFKTGILSFEIANRCYFVPEVRFYTRQD